MQGGNEEANFHVYFSFPVKPCFLLTERIVVSLVITDKLRPESKCSLSKWGSNK
jgi:hypothetical protein